MEKAKGKYIMHEGKYHMIEKVSKYGDGFIFDLINDGKKTKKQIKKEEIDSTERRLKDMDDLPRVLFDNWKPPKEIKECATIEEIGDMFLEGARELSPEQAMKRLSIYSDKETDQVKMAKVKNYMKKKLELDRGADMKAQGISYPTGN